MDEPKTHYQISLTARQAVGLFVGLLLALGLAFFFGLMAGMSGQPKPAVESAAAPVEDALAGDAIPQPEAGARTPTASAASRTELAAGAPAGLEPTAPATLQPFEDSAGEEPFPVPVEGKSPAAAAKAPATKPRALSGKVWVQAASLTSQQEASTLSARLSKHGFHALVLTTSGPKGKIYRVRVGPYRSEDEAARAAARLAKEEKIRGPWVVPEGK